MTLELQNGSGAQTLDIKQPEWQRQGYGVVGDVGTPGSGPCAVTVNGSGTLGAGGGALSVAAGDALVDGAVVSVSSTTVDISTGSASPRKDLLWVDQNGDLTVTEGTPTPHKPDGFSGFETYYPAVPFPATTPATCLATVWVPANASELTDTATNLQDRRMAASVGASDLVLGDRGDTPATPADGRTLYVDDADGNLYKVNPDGTTSQVGGNAGALTDSGTDTDGGDDYQLPTAADNIDLQGDGSLRNVEALDTEQASITKNSTQVVMSSDQPVSPSTITKVQFDTVDVDNLGVWDTANYKAVISEAGTYEVGFAVYYRSDSNWSNGDSNIMDIYLNGSQQSLSVGYDVAEPGNQQYTHPTRVLDLSAGDEIDFRVECLNIGGDVDINSANARTWGTIRWLG